ncbi:WAS/WASL-interacting protein family member 2-like [Ursus americanus]|uniref:WAS/WASL-interacting protein family member 2-like n=1 Tax=Ursus americanus TaxID=9643 RepID=UPI001E67A6E2|nr:WAS/WASL-interacting protein family member 2-like [Ursus americanus]XP_045627071.1 WAS/WASL-interacting protein family member 2-like [Ursus americanus]
MGSPWGPCWMSCVHDDTLRHRHLLHQTSHRHLRGSFAGQRPHPASPAAPALPAPQASLRDLPPDPWGTGLAPRRPTASTQKREPPPDASGPHGSQPPRRSLANPTPRRTSANRGLPPDERRGFRPIVSLRRWGLAQSQSEAANNASRRNNPVPHVHRAQFFQQYLWNDKNGMPASGIAGS